MHTKRAASLYQKFSAVVILAVILPMVILSTFIANTMIEEYRNAMRYQYEQAAGYVSVSLESMLESYNTISKLPYYYNFSGGESNYDNYWSFDNFRLIVSGEKYEPDTMQEQRENDMERFLKYVETVDSDINGMHFLAIDETGKMCGFHYSDYSSFMKSEDWFLNQVGYAGLDRETRQMILIPTHDTGYFSSMNDQVFTVARNYFDLRGEIAGQDYVGTIFIDVRLDRVAKLFRSVKFSNEEQFYVVNEVGNCFYSNDQNCVGKNISDYISGLRNTDKQLVISTDPNKYGLRVVVLLDTEEAFERIREVQTSMYLILVLAVLLVSVGSFYFSKRLTNPIREMMTQMEQIENGNFDFELQVGAEDEIGVLSRRFNQMSSALKTYINQSYLAQIRQNEAELTALKSQIYPHFLYNTLEIIRMTALEDGEGKVPEMIEALSEQIHYLIGPMQDMVPLEKEIDIVRKYVYLLNCRITGKVRLTVNYQRSEELMIPKLILQPIVENAYVHGIKQKKGSGNIMIDVIVSEEQIEIEVMDNGAGMDETALQKIEALLAGSDPGIKNEYNWQSIGLKNVHDRLRYLYGEQYGIEVTSTVGVGTMVRVVMPYNGEEKTHDQNDIGG